MAMKLNVKDLAVGSYQVSVTAIDAANNQTTRIVPIEINNLAASCEATADAEIEIALFGVRLWLRSHL